MYQSVLEHMGIDSRMKELGQQYVSLLEYNPDAILVFDVNGHLTFANAACEIMLGYCVEDLMGMSVLHFIEASERIRVLRRVIQVLHGNPQTFDTTISRADGQRVEVSVKEVPMIVEGNMCGYFAIVRDVTDWVVAHQELRTAKQLLESFVNQTTDAISVKDLQDKVLLANPAFTEMFGWDVEEIIGRSLPTVPDEFAFEHKAITETIRSGGHITGMETVRMRKDGTRIHTSLSVSPIRNELGQVIALAGVSRDISDRKKVEAALRDSESRYRLITEHMTDVIGTLSPDGRVTYAAPSSESVLGYDPETYTGEYLLNFIHEADKDRIRMQFDHMVASGLPCRVHFRYKHVDGHLGTLELQMAPVFHNDELESIVVVGREITERTKTEELLRKSEKLAALGQLAAGIAHEIRNPMTALRGFVQLLREQTEGRDEYFQIMIAELSRVEQIVSEFLMLSKPQVTQVSKRSLPFILGHVVSLLEAEAILRNVQITLHCSPEVPYVSCDDGQLKQVFVNLLKNAIEAMPDGGQLAVRCFCKDTQYVSVVVQDDGVGIPEENLRRLGEPFFTTKSEGTGLGLMVSHKIMEEHGGNLFISSEIGQGTTVEVLLPVSSNEHEARA
jgi:two-component system, sporulation sensor kinase A